MAIILLKLKESAQKTSQKKVNILEYIIGMKYMQMSAFWETYRPFKLFFMHIPKVAPGPKVAPVDGICNTPTYSGYCTVRTIGVGGFPVWKIWEGGRMVAKNDMGLYFSMQISQISRYPTPRWLGKRPSWGISPHLHLWYVPIKCLLYILFF